MHGQNFALILFSLLCFVVERSIVVAAGADAIISQKLVDYVAAQVPGLIQKELSSLKIPDQSGEDYSFDWHLKNIHVTSFSAPQPTLTFADNNGVKIHFSIDAGVGLDWSVRQHTIHFPYGSGSADVSCSKGTIDAEIYVSLKDYHPQVTLSNPSVSVGSVSISVHGSAWDWLIDIVKKAFNGSIKSAVTSAIKDALNKLPSTINSDLSTLDLTYDLPLPAPFNIAQVDFSIEAFDVVPNTIAQVELRASVNDTAGGDVPIVPTPLPPVPGSDVYANKHITLRFTDYLFDTAAYTIHHRGLDTYTITNDLLPSDFPLQLTTESFLVLAPGLKEYPKLNMSLTFTGKSADELPKVTFDDNLVKASGGLLMGFNVLDVNETTKSLNVFNLSCSAEAAANATIATSGSQEVMHFSLESAQCGDLQTTGSIVGDVRSAELSPLIDLGLTIVRNVVNKIITKGIPLPSMEGVSIQDAVITANDGVLMLQTDIEWNLKDLAYF